MICIYTLKIIFQLVKANSWHPRGGIAGYEKNAISLKGEGAGYEKIPEKGLQDMRKKSYPEGGLQGWRAGWRSGGR